MKRESDTQIHTHTNKNIHVTFLNVYAHYIMELLEVSSFKLSLLREFPKMKSEQGFGYSQHGKDNADMEIKTTSTTTDVKLCDSLVLVVMA